MTDAAPSRPVLIVNASPWTPGAPAWALHDGRRILASGTGDTPADSDSVPAGAVVDDAQGRTLAPGFVDVHCHGGAGAAFEDAGGEEAVLGAHGEHGTAALVASLVANPSTELAASVTRLSAAVGRAEANGARLAGIHLEGPCLSPVFKGAHSERFLVPPSVRLFEPLLEAAGGAIRQVTLAPELDDGLAATRFLVEHGVAVAVGHTNADYETVRAAFDAGASILTHTFNAMRGLHHRDPGPVAAALDSEDVWLELIADGVHVHPPLIRMLFDLAPERVLLVTDAMAATGCPDGGYRLGELDVDVVDGVARLRGAASIAGSTLTMDRAVTFAVECGVPAETAIRAATVSPARALGLHLGPGEGLGELRPGSPRPWLLDLPHGG